METNPHRCSSRSGDTRRAQAGIFFGSEWVPVMTLWKSAAGFGHVRFVATVRVFAKCLIGRTVEHPDRDSHVEDSPVLRYLFARRIRTHEGQVNSAYVSERVTEQGVRARLLLTAAPHPERELR